AAHESCVEEGPREVRRPRAGPRRRAELDALPSRLAEVAEIALAGGVAADEQQIVAVDAAKHAGSPRRRGRQLAAHAGFDRAGDDLPERRIAGHRVGQLARL